MRRMPRRIAVTAFALVCGASVAHVLGSGPFGGAEASADDAPFGRSASEAVVNSQSARVLVESEHLTAVALPAELPPEFQFFSVQHAWPDRAQVSFQVSGTQFVLCDGGTDVDSTCALPHVTVFLDREIEGRRVRVAQMDHGSDLTGASAEPAPETVAFWESVPITRGAAPEWLETMAAYEP